MARPSIHAEPMTAVERMRRYRERQRQGKVGQRDAPTVKQAAKLYDVSERAVYYTRVIVRQGIPELEALKLTEKKAETYSRSKLPWAFLADIARHDEETQAAMVKLINEEGADVARLIWADFKRGS
jgi:hypothetical protein